MSFRPMLAMMVIMRPTPYRNEIPFVIILNGLASGSIAWGTVRAKARAIQARLASSSFALSNTGHNLAGYSH
jgi:hypothetical protein